MNTLALDPSLHCGFATSSGQSGVWHLDVAGSEHAGKRLGRLLDHLCRVHTACPIDRIVFEKFAGAARGRAAQDSHGHLEGIILFFAGQIDVPWRAVNQMSVKAFAGSGSYTKDEMIRACEIKLGKIVRDNNEADALWILAYDQACPVDPIGKPKKKREPVRVHKRYLF